ncbi:uncharacterized protein K02A2.6-like [Photinus pyralis]|uniref:uncharacterized protein K02A2.6-like n=1 Tax=Photinus pyralis TaxID=7054 RepID=UPI0012674AE9|nr:uncharacterized protein K02A2.6-like [Photinus pyralis]
MRLMKFDYTIEHIPGKEMFTADTLSRAPLPDSEDDFTAKVEAHIKVVSSGFPTTPSRLEEIKNAQSQNRECQLLVEYVENGWPDHKKNVQELMKRWFAFRNGITIIDGLVCYNERMIIPAELREEIKEKLHDGHFGINRTLLRAKQSVFWPGITEELSNVVENCNICAKHRRQYTEKMIPSPTPLYPWQKIAVDYFEFQKCTYLAVVDYYSRYLDIINVCDRTNKKNEELFCPLWDSRSRSLRLWIAIYKRRMENICKKL